MRSTIGSWCRETHVSTQLNNHTTRKFHSHSRTSRVQVIDIVHYNKQVMLKTPGGDGTLSERTYLAW